MALTSDARSSVAAWTTCALPANVTSPTSMFLGRSRRNSFAASCAAARRVGLTSLTRMLSDTSMASMIDDLAHGSVTDASGTRGGEQQHRTSHQEQCGRHVAPPLAARCLADDVQAAVAQRRLAASAQQPEVQQPAAGAAPASTTGTEATGSSCPGRKDGGSLRHTTMGMDAPRASRRSRFRVRVGALIVRRSSAARARASPMGWIGAGEPLPIQPSRTRAPSTRERTQACRTTPGP